MHRMAAVQIALHVKLRQPDAGAELAVLHEQMVAFAAKLEHPDAGALESPYGRLPCPCRSAAKDRKSGGAQVVDGSATKKNPKSTPAGGLARSGLALTKPDKVAMDSTPRFGGAEEVAWTPMAAAVAPPARRLCAAKSSTSWLRTPTDSKKATKREREVTT